MALSLQPAQGASTPLKRHRHGGSAPEADEARAPLQGPVRLQRLPAAMELPYVLQHCRRARYAHGLQAGGTQGGFDDPRCEEETTSVLFLP